jgi:hypothetical protein
MTTVGELFHSSDKAAVIDAVHYCSQEFSAPHCVSNTESKPRPSPRGGVSVSLMETTGN